MRAILVVEDDEDLRDGILVILEMYGYEAFGAKDGVDALHEMRTRGRPGLILLDLRMPRMNGEELAAIVRRDPILASTPIVVLSGDTTAPEVAAAIGAVGLLVKPVDLPTLLAMVRRVLPAELSATGQVSGS
jgi:CheY-like chemotaxis protein